MPRQSGKLSTNVRSTVTRTSIRVGMNVGPNGPVWRWREIAMRLAEFNAIAAAPVNNPLNAVHRGMRVGEYKRSFSTDRRGSNQYVLRFSLSNSAAHAKYVEDGNSATQRWMYFSWSKGMYAGQPIWRKGRRGRAGKHIIEIAAKSAIVATTGGPL